MSRPTYAIDLEPEGSNMEDRVRVVEVGNTIVIAVADGVGGVSGSEQAAEAMIVGLDSILQSGSPLDNEATWTVFLEETDDTISRAGAWGETTAVVLAVTDRWICGASVGDSEGWLATLDGFQSFTAGQNRKPRLGSGSARPIAFYREHSGGALIVGTDGLFKYAPIWKICQVAVGETSDLAARTLIDLVRMPNGRLQDDVGLVVCDLGSLIIRAR